jgi:uncharacterized delta-60 repeat protein
VKATLISALGGAVLAAFLATASVAGAKPHAGHLDRSFGRDGLVRTQFGSGNSGARSVAIGRKHRIVVAGRAGDEFGVARYKPNGHVDHSFSRDGRVSTGFPKSPGGAHAVDIGKKGSVVAAGIACRRHGPCYFAVAKYKSNGHLDRSFGERGRKRIGFQGRRGGSATGVAVDAKGRVLLGGTSCTDTDRSDCEFALARLRRNGELDRSFGDGGRVLTQFEDSGTRASAVANSMAIGPRGDIVLGGSGCLATQSVDGRCAPGVEQVTLARYQPNGDPDLSFGHGGEAMYDLRSMVAIKAIVLDPRDRILAAGENTVHQWGLARFRVAGGLDRSFGDDGKVTTGFPGESGAPVPSAVEIDSRSRIVVAGRFGFAFALARYQPNGNLNRHFGHNGKVVKDFGSGHPSSCKALVVDSRDRPVVAGIAKRRFAVARFLG